MSHLDNLIPFWGNDFWMTSGRAAKALGVPIAFLLKSNIKSLPSIEHPRIKGEKLFKISDVQEYIKRNNQR